MSFPGQPMLPVTVTDFIGVASFSLTLNFNSSVLTYNGYQNLNAAVSGGYFSANAVGDKVFLTWLNTSAATIASGEALIELKFNSIPGTSPLTWDTQTLGNCEYSTLGAQVIFSTWNNGNVTINLPPSIGDHPINQSIYAGGSTTFSVTATGTGLAYLWQVSTNSGADWTNISNTSPYSGAYAPILTINPASTGMNGYLYHCIVSGTCTPSVTSNSAQLTVAQAAITTTPTGVTGSCTGNLNIPVNVTNCSNVGGISLTMIFDTTKMSFDGYHSVNSALSGGMLVVNRSGNKVLLTWASTTAANIGSGVLIQYRFRSNSGISTTLTWDTQTTGACEYSDMIGTVITSFYSGAAITVAVNALVADAGYDLTLTLGDSVQLNGLAGGGVAPLTYLWTPATGLSDPAIPNPMASPSSTTAYTLEVTDNTSCIASDQSILTVSLVPVTRSWTGAIDSAWNKVSNWSPAGVPGAQDNVVIPVTAAHMPVVEVPGKKCNNLTVRAGATLTINPGFTLTVNGLMIIEGP